MAEVVNMPKLGLQMTGGKITKWYVKEGDTVEKNMPIFAIETDKISTDVESTAAGVILKIAAREGAEIEITKPCCYIGAPGEVIDDRENVVENEDRTIAQDGSINLYNIPESGSHGRIAKGDILVCQDNRRMKITPVAKKLAAEYQIDYCTISGSGPHGRVQKNDILNAIEASKQPAVSKQAVSGHKDEVAKPMSAMRKTISKRLTMSKQTIPHVYFQNEINASNLLAARDLFMAAAAKKNGNKLSVNDIIMKAVALALSEFGDVNAQTDGTFITYFNNVNLGMAVSLSDGLIVPVIKNAQTKSVADISREAYLLAQKARAGKLMPDEYAGGTFTVSNLGGLGLDSFQAIINPPESGILAVGTARKKAVADGDKIVICPMMTIAGSFDHRLIDGALAAKFMVRVSALLEDAMTLFL